MNLAILTSVLENKMGEEMVGSNGKVGGGAGGRARSLFSHDPYCIAYFDIMTNT